MKKVLLAISLLAATAFSCADPSESSPPYDDTVDQLSHASDQSADQTDDESSVDDQSGTEEADYTEAYAKHCHVSCTVEKVAEGAFCPAAIGGDGNTTFLGGCRKACRFARNDAQSKIGNGCAINSCDESC